jgi:phosphatidylserine/phosphatidylglycerophosphate/cardiolipin synthase-like enzyme
MAVSAPNEQNPPQRLLIRTAKVATGVMNTLRMPGDVFIDRSGTWFNDATAVRRGNEVKFIVDAKNTFREMEAAIRTATKTGHFIYMSNWFVDLDLNLGRGTDLRALLTAADKSGVMVRAMFWDQVFSSQKHRTRGSD